MAALGKVVRAALAAGALGFVGLALTSTREREAAVAPPPDTSLSTTGDASLATRCRGPAGLYLSFDFAREAPWQRGRRYELVLSGDDVGGRCEFTVPLQPAADEGEAGLPRCSLTELPGREPGGIILSGTPARVKIVIWSDGAPLYRGEVAPRYGSLPNDCIYSTRVMLLAETGGSAP